MLKMFLKFSIVGVSGVAVNMAIFSILYLGFATDHMLAAVLSFLVAVSNNFYWNFIWTFKNRAQDKSTRRKYIQFFLISFINFIVNLIMLKLLVIVAGGKIDIFKELFVRFGLSSEKSFIEKVYTEIAQVISIGIASLLNFVGNYKITFRRTKKD